MCAALECKRTMTCWVQDRVGFILFLYYKCMIFFPFFFKCMYVDVMLNKLNNKFNDKCLPFLSKARKTCCKKVQMHIQRLL